MVLLKEKLVPFKFIDLLHLHSNMVLLKGNGNVDLDNLLEHLHSNMVLLKVTSPILNCWNICKFTFQYGTT